MDGFVSEIQGYSVDNSLGVIWAVGLVGVGGMWFALERECLKSKEFGGRRVAICVHCQEVLTGSQLDEGVAAFLLGKAGCLLDGLADDGRADRCPVGVVRELHDYCPG